MINRDVFRAHLGAGRIKGGVHESAAEEREETDLTPGDPFLRYSSRARLPESDLLLGLLPAIDR